MKKEYRYIDDMRKGIYPRDRGFEQYREIITEIFEDEIRSKGFHDFHEIRDLTEISHHVNSSEETEPSKNDTNINILHKGDKIIYRINNTFYLQEKSCFVAIDFQHGLKLITS